MDAKNSRKVLGMARDQQDEQAAEDEAEWANEEECVLFSFEGFQGFENCAKN